MYNINIYIVATVYYKIIVNNFKCKISIFFVCVGQGSWAMLKITH